MLNQLNLNADLLLFGNCTLPCAMTSEEKVDSDPVNAFFNLNLEPQKLYASTGQYNGNVVIPEEKQFPLPNALDRPLLGPKYAEQAKKMEFMEAQEQERTDAHSYVVNRDCMSGVDDLTSIGTSQMLLGQENPEDMYDKYDFDVRTVSQTLPINQFQSQIVMMIKSYQTTILKGATGCGKSTQVPQYILDSCYEQRVPCNIVVTQPRRIAARSVAQRVCHERGWDLGTLVGYQVGLDREHMSTDTRITFCTTGVLLQILVKEKSLDRYTHIVIDEVHERTQEMDFVLALIKKFLKSSPGVKVILMSATFNVERFAAYFGTLTRSATRYDTHEIIPASIVDLDKNDKTRSGIAHRTEIFYLEDVQAGMETPDAPGIAEEMYKVAVKLIKGFDYLEKAMASSQPGAVLVFLPGINEIERLFILLNKEPSYDQWVVKPLHSMITTEEQSAVFGQPPPGCRKIILSTNIAESSITVPDIAYVVDFILTKHLICDITTNFSSLQLTWASKTSCVQRAGRTGRTCNGRVYRLVSKHFYTQMKTEDKPEMLRGPLERVVTLAKALDMGEPKNLIGLTLDAPDEGHLNKAILLLKEKGALLPTLNGHFTWTDGDLTFLGRIMSLLPVDPAITKLIMLGHVFSCLEECIIMGAAMTLKSMFSTPFRKPLLSYHNRLSWADSSCSDPISFLNAYNTWRLLTSNGYFRRSAGGGEEQWAERNFIEIRSMYEVHLLVTELTRRLTSAGIKESTGHARVVWTQKQLPLILKVVIAGAFYPNYCCRGAQGGQIDEQDAVKTLNGLDPCSTVYFSGWPSGQPKQLYAESVKKPLHDCAHQMMVSFDGSSKAYVQFADTGFPGIPAKKKSREYVANIPGKILMGVYRAVKLRHLNSRILIPMLRSSESWARSRELGLAESNNESWVFERRPEPKFTVEVWNPKRTKLDSNMEILITYSVDAGHFWAQNKSDDQSMRNATWLDNQMSQPELLVPLDHRPKVGNLYAVLYVAPGEKPHYYRARIMLTTTRDEYEVHFIDYGNTQLVPSSSIRNFHPSVREAILDIPALSFECVLCRVQPSMVMNQAGLWTDEAQLAFDRLVSDADLFATIYSVCNGVVSLDLQAVKKKPSQRTGEMSVGTNLITQGYGQCAEESFLSQRNNEKRQRLAAAAEANSSMLEESPDELQLFTQVDVKSPTEDECFQTWPLRGPTSPLEMKVFAMTRAGVRHEVVIDPMSVNSVLLDTDPQDPHERLMVAACIAQNASGNRLTLRHSTLMPNLHGLPALMCLLFAPTLEFRVNRLRTLYTGAVCGLGYDPITKKAMFPENDIEVTFDTEISPTDLHNINLLRFWMNKCFVNDDDGDVSKADEPVVHEAKSRIKDLVLMVLRCQRKSVALSICPQPYKWNLIDKLSLIPPASDPAIVVQNEKRGVYMLHSGVILNTSPEEKKKIEDLLDNAQQLRQIANGSVEQYKQWVTCQMCVHTVGLRAHLKSHLTSHSHVSMEDGYRERIGMQSLAASLLT